MALLFRGLLLGSFLCGLFSVAAAGAQQPVAMPPNCIARNLDVTLLMQFSPATESNQHLLAIEIRNREQQPCSLSGVVLKLPPQEGDFGLGGGTRPLQAGRTVHLLLAWSSVPVPWPGLTMNDCTEHEMLRAYWAWPRSEKPFLEIRSLQMHSCGQIWGSLYRDGPYEPGEPIDKEWLGRFKLKPSDLSPLVPAMELEANSHFDRHPVVHTISDVEYLPGTFASGYSGYFELLLKVPSPVFANCPYSSLRKRESDGETVVYLNPCGTQRATPQGQLNVKDTRIVISAIGMLPQRTGLVEYDVVSQVVNEGKPVLAHAWTELSIRDPNQPMLPAIDTMTPPCRLSQLKLKDPPVELGSHWPQARHFAEFGEQWFDGKVFELTNVSANTCILGGVPELKYLNPPEMASGSLMSAVCRNCGNPVFKPRDSRWIDLAPNQSAHFIAVRTVLDADFQYSCTVLGGLDLSIPGDNETIRLPFEAGICGFLRVSAWREGRYDNDPLNIQYERDAAEREQKRAASIPPPLEKCAAAVTEDTGSPVVFRSGGGLTWALSAKPARYGDGVPVLLWLSNSTDKPIPVMTCGDIDLFWSGGVALFDSAGHRVLNRREEEEKKLRDSGRLNMGGCIFECTRNFPIEIAPHTCAHTTFSQSAYDFSRYLDRYYSIPPGHYVLGLAHSADGCSISATAPADNTGLPIVVLQP